MFKWLFNRGAKQETPKADILPAQPVGDDFQPSQGTFFQTLEYPVTGDDNQTVEGKTWMEAGLNPDTGKWVLWVKTVREKEDLLRGTKDFVRTNKVLFEDTSFVNAYKQMTTFTDSMEALGTPALGNKTMAKLGGDFFKQFAWRENLMMSRSGRLYPVSNKIVAADNFFNEQDLKDAKAFLNRHNKEKFIAVPIVLPATDWAKAYEKSKTQTDERLRNLYYRYGNDVNSFDMAKQIVANERPEVLYAYLQGDVLGTSFNPKVYEGDAEKHFALLEAAVKRTSVEPLSLLSDAGINFYVRYNNDTAIECAVKEKHYSHLHLMLSRDGVKLANYADETGVSPAVQAVQLRDNQAFRMIYLEGIDYSQEDDKGWYLIHHAFENDFSRGINAWIDEGLPIDFPIKGTNYTGVSIAKQKGNYDLLSFAKNQGADMNAPELPGAGTTQKENDTATAEQGEPAETKPVAEYSLSLLSSDTDNDTVKAAAQNFVKSGGDLNALDENGAHVLELCWKNHKASKPELDRRALIEFFGKLGADPSASLSDGATVLTREARSRSFDLDFISAIAPYAKNINNADSDGENIMHALQLNANDQNSHSNNIRAVLKLFSELDLNKQSNEGYSNIGLAIRLSRTNTMKEFIKHLVVNDGVADFTQTTAGGWSYLDIAFTSAFNQEKGKNFPLWANKIDNISDRMRQSVLGMVNRAMTDGSDEQKQALFGMLNRARPDGQTLGQVMTREKVSEQLINGLSAWGMKNPQRPAGPGVKPG